MFWDELKAKWKKKKILFGLTLAYFSLINYSNSLHETRQSPKLDELFSIAYISILSAFIHAMSVGGVLEGFSPRVHMI